MKEIKLTQGKVALVDDEDFEYLNQWKWCAIKGKYTFYAIRRIRKRETGDNSKMIFMHVVIMDQIGIDHKNGEGLDNQKLNLRICNGTQNNLNQHHVRGKCKYKGVTKYKNKRGDGFIISARLKINGKYLLRSYHNTELDAAMAYDAAAIKYCGEFANLNFK